ncbi:MAG: hypothetical protein MMC23_005920 [Stictis urceolatum]|nr:hypothetical protein [Stictis urceolata]
MDRLPYSHASLYHVTLPPSPYAPRAETSRDPFLPRRPYEGNSLSPSRVDRAPYSFPPPPPSPFATTAYSAPPSTVEGPDVRRGSVGSNPAYPTNRRDDYDARTTEGENKFYAYVRVMQAPFPQLRRHLASEGKWPGWNRGEELGTSKALHMKAPQSTEMDRLDEEPAFARANGEAFAMFRYFLQIANMRVRARRGAVTMAAARHQMNNTAAPIININIDILNILNIYNLQPLYRIRRTRQLRRTPPLLAPLIM